MDTGDATHRTTFGARMAWTTDVMPALRLALLGAALASALGCGTRPAADGDRGPAPADDRSGSRAKRGEVEPGITVLLDDSVHLVRGKRVGLLTNQTGVDRAGTSDIDLLRADPRAVAANVRLVMLFSPEHGIRGTEDREHVESGVDARSGLPVHSLYGRTTLAPPDSLLRQLDVLVLDLQDIGTRTWTYVGNVVYALRAAKRTGVPIVVLDRPAPLGGLRRDGPMLDAARANAEEDAPRRPALPYALYPTPLRHGMTMGELALFLDDELKIGAPLRVVPMRGWRRAFWYDDTGLPWVRPSPNLPALDNATIYPALVGFESSNVSVGRGTDAPFMRLGAPWLNAKSVVGMLEERELGGVTFADERFSPSAPGDRKYDGRTIPGIRITITDRERVHTGRVGAALLWAIARAHPDSLRLDTLGFDRRFGSATARRALVRGDDPDSVIDESLPAVVEFDRRARRFQLYR